VSMPAHGEEFDMGMGPPCWACSLQGRGSTNAVDTMCKGKANDLEDSKGESNGLDCASQSTLCDECLSGTMSDPIELVISQRVDLEVSTITVS
jgi:hypothetical protein